MYRTIQFILLVISIMVLPACEYIEDGVRGNGEMIEKTVTVDAFDKIDIGGNYEIVLVEGEQEQVVILADENLLDFVDVSNRGKTLVIDNKRPLNSKKGIELTVFYSKIEEIKIGGACSINNEGTLRANDLEIDMTGAGAVSLNLDAENVEIGLSGAGSLNLEGKANRLEVDMSGAGGLDAEHLETKKTDVSISGVGGAHVFATDYLKGRVGGMGSITYSGNPNEVDTEVNGLGSISRKE